MHGELVLDLAWCCQPHRMAHGQHLNLKWIWMDGFCTGMPWELLYADDLELITDTKEECISKLNAWKAGWKVKGSVLT